MNMNTLPQHQLAIDLEFALGDPNDESSIMSYKRVIELDEREDFQEEFFQYLMSRKIHHYYVPRQYGGQLDSYEQLYALGKVLARRDLSTAVTMSTMVWSTLVWVGGNKEQKKQCADLTLSIHGAQCLAYSEEHHGSDLLANEFRADATENGYRLSGEKWPINRAARSDVVMLLAKTADNFGARNLSLFMVEKSKIDCAKYTYLPKIKTHGLRGCDICGIRFEGAEVPASTLIGEPGQGLELAIKAFQITRTLCVALSIGALENNLRVVTEFAMVRKLYHGAVFDIPNAQRYLSGAFTNVLLTDALGSALVRALHCIPGEFSVLSAVAKCFAPLKLDKSQKDLATVLGARFFFRENHKEGIFQKSYRDSQVVSLFDGSSEVNLYSLCTQLPLIARRQLKLVGNKSTVNYSILKNIFDAKSRLPPFDGQLLDLASHARDQIMESFTELKNDIELIKGTSNLHKYMFLLANKIYEKHIENMQWVANNTNNGLDIRSPKMFSLAKQYCITFAAVTALHYWKFNQHQADRFIRDGYWLVTALYQLADELHLNPPELPSTYWELVAQELVYRTEQSKSYGIVAYDIPDSVNFQTAPFKEAI